MYAGRIVEHADVHALYAAPGASVHEGAARLDSARTSAGRRNVGDHQGPAAEPHADSARLPLPSALPVHAADLCTTTLPPSVDLGDGRTSACHFAREVLDGRALRPSRRPARRAAAAQVDEPRQALPAHAGRGVQEADRRRQGGRRRELRPARAARRSASSASRAAASRRWPSC